MSFNIIACGSRNVQITGLPFTMPDPQFTTVNPPTTPFMINQGAMQAITVRYTPTNQMTGAHAVISVNSDDMVSPSIPVTLDGGPEIVPPAAGKYLYYWSAVIDPNSGAASGDIRRLALQGSGSAGPYWGSSTGKPCSGCHALSPDGRYLALSEFGSLGTFELHVVDTMTQNEVTLPFRIGAAVQISWRPDVNSTPPYQFAFDDTQTIQITSVMGSGYTTLGGTSVQGSLNVMPSWGPNGKIAFVKGTQNDPNFGQPIGLGGTSDVMIVDEAGGTPQPLGGASGNGALNYYPSYSPDGHWIAFTTTHDTGTYGAANSVIRLASADNSGTVAQLPMANQGGAASFPTWSADGTLLSFSSNRPGSVGDWDIWYVPINSATGVEGAPVNLMQANTPNFDHVARWSP
jgi:hypothetical protein